MADRLTKAQRSACMKAVKSRDTTPELVVRSALHRLGCRFALHRADLPGKPDIVMSARHRIVLVHGCFWHGHACPHGRRKPATNAAYWRAKIARNKARDRRTLGALRRAGWRVLVVWECQTRDGARLSARLKHLVQKRLTPFARKLPLRYIVEHR
jgi:DNA mismatch endonuclease (patch repair protein)